MKNNNQIKDIINLCMNLENLCEGFDNDSKTCLISTKLKMLLLVSEEEKISPSMLIEKLALAKSNITLLSNSMIKEGLIKKEKDELDKRIIFYSITEKGTKLLNESLEKMSFNFNRQLAYKNKFNEIESLVKKLNELIK